MLVVVSCIKDLMKVKVRLDTYEKQTRPLIDYYTMKGQITNINGDQSMEDVFKDIKASLGVK